MIGECLFSCIQFFSSRDPAESPAVTTFLSTVFFSILRLWFSISPSTHHPAHCHGYQFRLQRSRPENIRHPPGDRHPVCCMFSVRHLLSSRTCVPGYLGPSIIPRSVLLQPFRSRRYIRHAFPRWSRPRLINYIPFAPVRFLACCPSKSSTVSTRNQVKMGSVLPFDRKHKVTVVGSGNWYVHCHGIVAYMLQVANLALQGHCYRQDCCRKCGRSQHPLRREG